MILLYIVENNVHTCMYVCMYMMFIMCVFDVLHAFYSVLNSCVAD